MEIEKMIDEMVKDITDIRWELGHSYLPQSVGAYERAFARELDAKGYRKIPDGAVLLSAEERDEEMREYNRDRAEREEQARKDTAREILNRIASADHEVGDTEKEYAWYLREIKELAEKYGVEVEE